MDKDSGILILSVNHRNYLCAALYEMQQKGHLCDVTIVSKSGPLHIHQLVLSAAVSPVTSCHNFDHGLCINLESHDYEAINLVLCWMYTGCCLIKREKLSSVIQICKILRLNELTNEIQRKFPAYFESGLNHAIEDKEIVNNLYRSELGMQFPVPKPSQLTVLGDNYNHNKECDYSEFKNIEICEGQSIESDKFDGDKIDNTNSDKVIPGQNEKEDTALKIKKEIEIEVDHGSQIESQEDSFYNKTTEEKEFQTNFDGLHVKKEGEDEQLVREATPESGHMFIIQNETNIEDLKRLKTLSALRNKLQERSCNVQLNTANKRTMDDRNSEKNENKKNEVSSKKVKKAKTEQKPKNEVKRKETKHCQKNQIEKVLPRSDMDTSNNDRQFTENISESSTEVSINDSTTVQKPKRKGRNGIGKNVKKEEEMFSKTCPVCPGDVSFSRIQRLAEHMWNQHNIAHMEDKCLLHVCGYCQFRCSNEQRMAHHQWVNHKARYNEEKFPIYECKHEGCDFTGVFSFEIRRHNKTHLKLDERERFICSVCGKNFMSKQGLLLCESSHTTQETFKYKCEKCGLKFFYRSRLNQHMRTHEKSLCYLCSKILRNEYNLNKHLYAVHGVPLPKHFKMYKCDKCSYETPFLDSYKRHSETGHGQNIVEDKKTCPICFNTYNGERSLMNHMYKHKNDTKELVHCTYEGCNYTTRVKRRMKVHVASRHMDERPFACHLCSYTCKLAGNLRIHLRGTHKEKVVTLKTLYDKFKETGSGYEAVQEKRRELMKRPEHLVGL